MLISTSTELTETISDGFRSIGRNQDMIQPNRNNGIKTIIQEAGQTETAGVE
jgi:hypothetical protein